MYNIIQHSHSGIMWLAVSMLVLSVLFSLLSLIKNNESFSLKWFKFYKITKWVFYIQTLLGLTLYFISPKVSFESGFMKSETLRFYAMEHPIMMLIVVALISIGLFKARKKEVSILKSKTVFIYYTIALVVVALMVPWETVLA